MRQLELFDDKDESASITVFTRMLIPIVKVIMRRKNICPECNKVHDDPSRPPEGCDMVYGRRGWRQLGVYDG